MPRRRQQVKNGKAQWWRKHRTALISVATAIGLLLVGAILSPVGDRLVEAIWPNTDGRAPEQSLQSPGGRLVTISRWPPQTDLECDASTKVAELPGAPEPAGLLGNQDIRTMAMDQLGAIVWYHGTLNITLTTIDAAPSLITAVKPVIHKRQEVVPSWGLEVSPGCGGPSQTRLLRATLDHGKLEDLGVEDYGPPNPRARREAFGPTFTVTDADAADLTIEVNACEGLYDFGVDISYMEAGQQFTARLGTADNPYRIIGGWRNVQRFHSAPVIYGNTGVQQGPLPLDPTTPSTEGVPLTMTHVCA